jgi:hypothetical protein
MKLLLPVLLLLAVPFASVTEAQGGSPVAGISKTETGVGSGPTAAGSTLDVTYSSRGRTLNFTTEAPVCCNILFTRHFLAVGSGVLGTPAQLREPTFLPQSFLYMNYATLLGPFSGDKSTVSVPSSPSLIGLTVGVQSVPEFFTTTTGSIQYGASQLISITFE